MGNIGLKMGLVVIVALLLSGSAYDTDGAGGEIAPRVGLMRAVSKTYETVVAATEVSPPETSEASEVPPEVSSGVKKPDSDPVPAPTLPASLTVRRDRTVVRMKPTNKVRRRGVVMRETRLPIFEAVEGPGCLGRWFRVMDEGWVCEADGRTSDAAPTGVNFPSVPAGAVTPWPYGFVREPTLEYRLERGYLVETRELLKGFGFGVADTVRIDGNGYFETAEGTLIPRQFAGISGRISTFEGVALPSELPHPIGFVARRNARVWAAPERSKANRLGTVDRYRTFEVLETVGTGRKRFYRFDEGAWLAASDVRVPRPSPLPKGVEPGERWIDVDTARQLITAYEGEILVYTTLISSGRHASPTVKGEYRIWAKIAAIAMDNTDEELEETPPPESLSAESGTDTDTAADTDSGASPERHLYSLHDVPWTQFFFESYALHGVYWHDAFGNRRSHGCVNLSPKDAAWFYNWTEPRIPPGFWAVHSTKNHPGTLVRVR